MTATRLAIAILALGLAPVLAQDADETPPRVQATRVGDVVAVTGSYLETSACETFEGARAGAPEGAMPVAGALAATVSVRHSGADFCALVATERPWSLVLPGGAAANLALYTELRTAGAGRRVTLQVLPISGP